MCPTLWEGRVASGKAELHAWHSGVRAGLLLWPLGLAFLSPSRLEAWEWRNVARRAGSRMGLGSSAPEKVLGYKDEETC